MQCVAYILVRPCIFHKRITQQGVWGCPCYTGSCCLVVLCLIFRWKFLRWFFFFFLISCLCACVSLCAAHACSACKGRMRALYPLELGVIGSCEHHAGAGNWTWVPCKSSKHSQPLNHLSSPMVGFHYFLNKQKHFTSHGLWHYG